MSRSSFVKLRRYRPAGDPFALRVTQLRDANPGGEHILYHARSARRVRNNPALEFAKTLGKNVIVAEWLDEPHLSPRIEAFIRNGAARNAAAADVDYRFEPERELIARARYVVTDEFPTLPIPPYATHVVDGNGILPMRAIEKEQYSAKFFRDKAFKLFEQFWPLVEDRQSCLSIDRDNLVSDIHGYADRRNGTGLSPSIHFGHVGVHEVATSILHSDAREEDIDAFLEQLIIRRELAFNMCFYNRNYASLAALPEWAMRTLNAHRDDRRKPCYAYEELERAETHDDVWNLAQRQLVACGTIHNYLRMLWGKKIIEWSATPEEAHSAMVRLHDRHALDGRDPNTHAGILWCFGKHDRPWAPERPIFGTIRWMSSEQTRKKVRLAELEAAVARCEQWRSGNPASPARCEHGENCSCSK